MAAEEVLYIEGGTKLTGEGEAQGAKNAALPMIAASVLAEQGQTVLHRVPPVKDVLVALEILRQLGAKVDFDAAAGDLVIDASGIHTTALPADLTGRMRASILFVGPLLSRFRTVSVEEVGGCNIGERATDYHYRGFARMGAKVEGTRAGGYRVEAEKLIGANMYCDLPSHTGVENLVMAASLAKGESTIVNAASDPEIADFAQLLGKMGAQVEGVGTRTVRIRGTGRLRGAEHTVMYDRLDAAMLMMAGAITGGDIALKGVNRAYLEVFEAKLLQMGVEIDEAGEWVSCRAPESLSPINVVSTYYPGFPTDLQPSITALACIAEGDSYIRETVFEDRFGHVKSLRAFGAQLSTEKDALIIVRGPAKLRATRIKADDIRAGAACVLAGLAASGRTSLTNLYELDRGHHSIEKRLQGLGAKLERL